MMLPSSVCSISASTSTRSMISSTSTRSMIFWTSTRSISLSTSTRLTTDQAVDVDPVEERVDVDRFHHHAHDAFGHRLGEVLGAVRTGKWAHREPDGLPLVHRGQLPIGAPARRGRSA